MTNEQMIMSQHLECKSLNRKWVYANEPKISQAQLSEAFILLRRWMLLALSLIAPCIFANLAFSQTATLVAYGTTDIFHSSACYAFPAAAGQSVTFSSVTGLAGFGGPVGGIYSTSGDGADPSLAGTTGVNLPPQGVFSGLQNIPGLVFFLTGVFVGPSDSVPPTINFSGNTNFTQISPLINQLFFIGDGLTGTGSGNKQVFHVPDAATGLCLGFGDGAYFSGAPTFSDNWGSLTAVFTISGCIDPRDVTLKLGSPDRFGNLESITGSFIPGGFSTGQPIGLMAAAAKCGVDRFDWVQEIENWPSPSGLKRNSDLEVLFTPPSFNDPPLGGYTYQFAPTQLSGWLTAQPNFADAAPFYYSPLDVPNGCAARDNVSGLCLQSISDALTLNFYDAPKNTCLPGGVNANNTSACEGLHLPNTQMIMSFRTSLVGVCGSSVSSICTVAGEPSLPLRTWTWTSDFNGTRGGASPPIAETASIYTPDPNSGSGGVTITSIDGLTLQPIPTSQIRTTASGLAYSRVSRTFNGTVTIENVGKATISGPLQIVLMSLTPGVELLKASGNFVGNAFITSSTSEISPGQSAVVAVQFKNPANLPINFYPRVYAGSLN